MHTPLEIVLQTNFPEERRRFWVSAAQGVRWLFARPSQRSLGRVVLIDVLRGVVCLSIVCGHNGLYRAWWDVPGVGPAFQFFNWARPGTECFMVLSGFFIGYMLRPRATPIFSVRQFLRGRLIRLAYPFWVAMAVAYLLWAVLVWLVPGYRVPPTVPGGVADFFFLTDVLGTEWVSYSYWSLQTLFQAYLLWTAVFWVVRWGFLAAGRHRYHQGTTQTLSALSVAGLVAGGVILAGDPHGGWMLPKNLAYLSAGWLVYQMVVGAIGRWVIPLGMGVLLAAAVASETIRPLYAVALVPLLAVAGRSRVSRAWGPLRWLTVVGGWSYSIYLAHGFVGHKLFRLADSGGWERTPLAAVALMAVTLAVSVGVGIGFYFLIERPIARLARQDAVG